MYMSVGDSVDDAIMKELKQIHSFETYEPLKASDQTWEEKKQALNSLLFVTEKETETSRLETERTAANNVRMKDTRRKTEHLPRYSQKVCS